MSLYQKLKNYAQEDYYPFHMPGHKRNTDLMPAMNPYAIDITEIDGFDNMHDPQDIILESMNRTATLYHSQNTLYLVNGSTAGILTGISACTQKGDKVLVARNCHKSVYHGLILNELEPIYIYPQYDHNKGIQCGYSEKYIEEMLIKNANVQCIILVSPTYEGVVSEIEEICRIAHKRNIPVLVDEAHGAHFHFHNEFPKSAVDLGADVVIQSVHKTLPAFTQTALLHVNSEIVDIEKIKAYSSIYQTSSPSYIFMAGIEYCMDLIQDRGQELFQRLVLNLKKFYEEMQCLKHLKVIDYEGRDMSKIIISTKETNMTGTELYDILLNNYKLQMEMAEADYVLAIASVGDTEDGFRRLQCALIEIDSTMEQKREGAHISYYPIEAKVVLLPHEVFHEKVFHVKKCTCLLEESINHIAGSFVYLYPPGIPILAPGELIQEEMIERIHAYLDSGLSVKGLLDKKYILVVNREDEKCQKYL